MPHAEQFLGQSRTSAESTKPAAPVEDNTASPFHNELNNLRQSESSLMGSLSRGYTVLKDMAAGAADELINHKRDLATDFVVGAGLTAFAKSEPKIALGAAIAVTGIAGAVTYKHSDGLWQMIKTATDEHPANLQSKFEAEQNLQKLGAASTELAVAFVGGFIARKLLGRSETAVDQALVEVFEKPLPPSALPVNESFRPTIPKLPSIHDGPQLDIFKSRM